MKTTTTLLGLVLSTSLAIAQVKPPVATAPPTASVNTTAAANVGQTVVFNATSYVVNAKTQLIPNVEYYTVKTSALKAKNEFFVRSNGRYNRTTFTLAQFQNFLKTGKMSSFGTVKEKAIYGRPQKYVSNATSTIVFLVKKSGGLAHLFEFPGTVDVLAADNGNGCNYENCAACADPCMCGNTACYRECMARGEQTEEECNDLSWECYDVWCGGSDTPLGQPTPSRPSISVRHVLTMTKQVQ